MNYEIATKRKLYDYTGMTEEQEEIFREELIKEQDAVLKQAFGECYYDMFYMIRHKSTWVKEDHTVFWDIDDAINCLAVKDGVDLVKFDNGNLGYVGYYNGRRDIVEIVAKAKDIEKYVYSLGGNEIDVENYMDGLEEIVLHSLEEIKENIYNYS